MLCDTCKFWDQEEENNLWGKCRRYAPRPLLSENMEADRSQDTQWPRTKDRDFCGEWSARVEREEA